MFEPHRVSKLEIVARNIAYALAEVQSLPPLQLVFLTVPTHVHSLHRLHHGALWHGSTISHFPPFDYPVLSKTRQFVCVFSSLLLYPYSNTYEHVEVGRGTCIRGCQHVTVHHRHAVKRLWSLAPVLLSRSCCSCYAVEDNRPRGALTDTGKSTKKQRKVSAGTDE